MNSLSLAAFAMMASGVVAFAPASSTTSSSVELNAGMPDRMWDSMVDKTERSKALPFLPRPVNLDGSMVGDVGFDPFYLSSIPKNFAGFLQPPSWENTAGLPTLYWMREAELKHSRICMLAWFGWVATDGGFGVTLRFPGEIYSVESIPTAYEAHNILVGQGSMTFMLLAIGFIEFCTGAVLVEVSKGESDRPAGNFGLDPMSFLKGKSDAEVKRMELTELLNGRLAMLAFSGVCTQTALGDAHHAFPYL
jgi:Chlorophyll A-B binding protein